MNGPNSSFGLIDYDLAEARKKSCSGASLPRRGAQNEPLTVRY
jgi:hypothetical protein